MECQIYGVLLLISLGFLAILTVVCIFLFLEYRRMYKRWESAFETLGCLEEESIELRTKVRELVDDNIRLRGEESHESDTQG